MNQSILLLGGAKHQVPVIEKAKELGFTTILCDYLPDNPGQYVADIFYQESTTDKECMLEIAKKHKVSGVLAFGTDVAAGTAAYIGEKLHLPTNPLASVEILSEKQRFRAFLQEHGFNCPKFVSLDMQVSASEVLEKIEGFSKPIVIKPTDSSGSKGVTVLEDVNEASVAAALVAAKERSRNGVLICEEYIRSAFPRVIGGDVFVAGGKVVFWGLMSCLRDTLGSALVPAGERWPSGLNESRLQACKDEISRLVSELKLQFGELNVEILMADNDQVYFLELAARAGGNMIPNQLSDISGQDLIAANVLYAMDKDYPIAFDGIHADKTYAAAYTTYMLHAPKCGIYKGITLKPEIESCLYRQVDYVDIGSKVEAFGDASKALGVLFLKFDTLEQLEDVTENINLYVNVIVDEG